MSLIILARDGVINQELADFVREPAQWEPIDNSLESIARLNHAGYSVIVITHQPGIARGLLDVEMLAKIHSKMRRMLAQAGGFIEAVFYCPHELDECRYRQEYKSEFTELSQRLRLDLKNVVAVGNSQRSVDAAQYVGARPILVKTGQSLANSSKAIPKGVEVYDDLAAVVSSLLDS